MATRCCENVQAKQVAKQLFDKYGFGASELGLYQMGSILRDLYSGIGSRFVPSSQDIKGFMRMLDHDQDGRITLQDLEAKAVLELCGGECISFRRRYSPKVQAKLSAASTLFQEWQNSTIDTNELTVQTHKILQCPLSDTISLINEKKLKSYGDFEEVLIKLLENKGVSLYQS